MSTLLYPDQSLRFSFRVQAYKLARKPSLSPSPSFFGHSISHSPRSRSSSIDSLESSASEEMFDLSFESSHLSPPSSNVELSPSSIRNRIPPRWSGRRRSSATTIEEEVAGEDRLKRSAMRRADEMFGRVHEEEEEELRDQEELHGGEEENEDDATPRALRSCTSSESFGNRFQSPKTLRSTSSVPLLRGSPSTSPSVSRRPSYSTNGPRSPALKPLFTSISPDHRRSYLPTPSPSLGSPSLQSRIPTNRASPSSPQLQLDPFSSSGSTPRQFSSSSNRKSSLPTPSSLPQPTFASRRPSAPPDSTPTQHHRRKSSLHTLTYKHSPLVSPAASPTQLRLFACQSSNGSRSVIPTSSIPRR